MEWIVDEETGRFTSSRRVYDCPAAVEAIGLQGLIHRYPPGHHYRDHRAHHSRADNRREILYTPGQSACVYCDAEPLLWDNDLFRPYTLVPWVVAEEP